ARDVGIPSFMIPSIHIYFKLCFFFSSRRRHTRFSRDWSSDVCSSDLGDTDLAATYRAHAARTAKAVNDHLWDADAGAYKVSPSDGRHPQDGNAMAVVAGVATGDRARSVLKFFGDALAGPHGDLTVDEPGGTVPQYISPFVSAQALLAHSSQGDMAGA